MRVIYRVSALRNRASVRHPERRPYFHGSRYEQRCRDTLRRPARQRARTDCFLISCPEPGVRVAAASAPRFAAATPEAKPSRRIIGSVRCRIAIQRRTAAARHRQCSHGAPPRVGGPEAERSGAGAPGVPWPVPDIPRSPRGDAGRPSRLPASFRGRRTFVSAKRGKLPRLICVFMDDVSESAIRYHFGKG